MHQRANAARRGSWSTLPAIGIVRWRNVGEALSPIRNDGLSPRFVRYDTGGHYDDMVHVWHLMRDITPDAQRAIDEAGAVGRAHVA
jgi:hypothetical protein